MSKKHQPASLDMTPCKTELGSFIRARRLELDLRQVQLSTQCGLHQSVIGRIEIGVRKYLDEKGLGSLSQALKCDVCELRKRMPVKPGTQPITELGKLIHSRRAELGMTLEDFANKIKMTTKKAKQLEIRKNPSIHYKLIKPLAKALDLELSALVKFASATRKESKSELGNLVRLRRKELGMSLSTLAEKLGVRRQFVSYIEFGQATLSASDKMIAKLALVLEIDREELESVRLKRRMNTKRDGLGEFLTAKRLELKLTQRELAEQAGVSLTLISALETGRWLASTKALDRLSEVLNCKFPPELIPPPHVRKYGSGRTVSIERKTELGRFVTKRRLELKLNQRQAGKLIDTSSATISRIECGRYCPGSQMIERLSKALECEIPSELIPTPRKLGRQGQGIEQDGFILHSTINLSGQDLTNLEEIKRMSDIRVNTEVVRKALRVLRVLLEKKKDGHVVCLHKGDTITQLEFFF